MKFATTRSGSLNDGSQSNPNIAPKEHSARGIRMLLPAVAAMNRAVQRNVASDAYGNGGNASTYVGASFAVPATGGNDAIYAGAGNDVISGDSADTPLAAQGGDYLDGEALSFRERSGRAVVVNDLEWRIAA